ncbi:hypothetical protein APHAL10511_000352 [Amanita phalloides]|nr:hypothetical protein APHAL10511_000352 [Amanita phalloides]
MAPLLEVHVPEFVPPPKAYAVSVKPIYGSNHHNGDISQEHEEGEGEGRGRVMSIRSGERSNHDDGGDRSVFSNHSFLQANMHRTGLHHYRELHDRPLGEIFKFLGLAMPNPRFACSKCTGRRKALCIGINYLGQKNQLKGCVNDALNVRKFLMQNYGFRSSEIMLMTDESHEPRLHPTRQNMIAGMQWLVEGARPHDSLFLHYSGHGGQKRTEDDDEADGLDEVIFPVDFQKSGDIIDNELNQILVQPLPSGCRLTGLFDCCHSGTVLDLPYLHSAHGRIKKTHISKRARRRDPPPADVICFSACKDDETSADTFEGGMYVGAMSYGLIKALKENPNQTYDQVLESVRNILRSKYKQKPQLGASNPVDLQAKFML